MVNIFIVEDDHSLRLLYEKALSLNGYNVIGAAKDGEEAIEMYKAFNVKPGDPMRNPDDKLVKIW